jgi:hypothetical protein
MKHERQQERYIAAGASTDVHHILQRASDLFPLTPPLSRPNPLSPSIKLPQSAQYPTPLRSRSCCSHSRCRSPPPPPAPPPPCLCRIDLLPLPTVFHTFTLEKVRYQIFCNIRALWRYGCIGHFRRCGRRRSRRAVTASVTALGAVSDCYGPVNIRNCLQSLYT